MRIVIAMALIFALSGCAAPEAANAPVELQTQESAAADSGSTAQAEESEETETAEPEATESEEPTVEPTAESTAQTSSQPQQSAEASPSPTATATPTPTTTPTPTPTQTETAAAGFTMAEVRQNNTAASCWVAVDGRVFDLTQWITRHPGGAGAITQLCGTDGTTSFNSRHGGQSSPTATLESYDIGPLR